MKMYALDCGSMYLDESLMLSGAHTASLRNQNPKAEWVRIPVCVYLIESSVGYILYDTGCHEREANIAPDADTPSPYVYAVGQLLPDRLKALNVSPDDIKYVVMSHLHCDHAGYLYMFKNAQIIVSDIEFTQSMRLYGLNGFGSGPYISADFEAFLSAKLDWRLMNANERELELCSGVTAVQFGSGHTFGLTGLLVELPNSGNVLLCSDALYRPENLGPPIRLPGLVYDSLGYIASAEFIAGYAKKHNAKIIFGHDPVQFDEIIKSGGVL